MEKELPQDIEAEEVVLGALIIEKEAYDRVSNILTEECFYLSKHRLIYRAIDHLAREGKAVDSITIKDELASQGTLESVGGVFAILELSSKLASSVHLESHARIIVNHYKRRETIKFAMNLCSVAYDETNNIGDTIDLAENSLSRISSVNTIKDYLQINPIVEEAYREVDEAKGCAGGISGIPSGFGKIDEMMSGFQDSDFVIIGGRPSMGKTALGLNIASHTSIIDDIPTAVFSLEMSATQLMKRMFAGFASVDLSKIINGSINESEQKRIDQAVNTFMDKPLYIDDSPSMTVFELRNKARRMVRENDVKLIVIDYVQLLTVPGVSEDRQRISIVSNNLKSLAKEINIPIIGLAQLNRDTEDRGGVRDKRPRLSDLKGSGSLEQDADAVLFIHRPEYYGITADEQGDDLRGIAEVIISKQRNGSTGIVKLEYEGKYTQFKDYDRAYRPPHTADSYSFNDMPF